MIYTQNRRKISPRELTCLNLLAAGYNAKQVASKLDIKLVTVRTYINRLVEKLDAKNLVEAVKIACHEEIIKR